KLEKSDDHEDHESAKEEIGQKIAWFKLKRRVRNGSADRHQKEKDQQAGENCFRQSKGSRRCVSHGGFAAPCTDLINQRHIHTKTGNEVKSGKQTQGEAWRDSKCREKVSG